MAPSGKQFTRHLVNLSRGFSLKNNTLIKTMSKQLGTVAFTVQTRVLINLKLILEQYTKLNLKPKF